MGRFMSPDWSAKLMPVPYAKLDNPQTLNLYAYVGNNPLETLWKPGDRRDVHPFVTAKHWRVAALGAATMNNAALLFAYGAEVANCEGTR